MPTLDKLSTDRKLKVMVVGYFKEGKTAGALTFPRPNVLDFDCGTDVGLAPWWRERFKRDPSKILYERFPERGINKAGVPVTHNAFDDANAYVERCMQPDRVDTFDTWIIDSGTTLGEAARNKAIILLGGTRLTSKPLSYTHKTALDTGMIHMKMQDYGGERSLLEQFIDKILATDKHVVLICHAKDEYEGEGADAKIVGTVPLLTGQSVQRVSIKFNEIYWVEIIKAGSGRDAFCRIQHKDRIKSGSRFGLPDMTPWNWDDVTAALAKQGFTFSTGV